MITTKRGDYLFFISFLHVHIYTHAYMQYIYSRTVVCVGCGEGGYISRLYQWPFALPPALRTYATRAEAVRRDTSAQPGPGVFHQAWSHGLCHERRPRQASYSSFSSFAQSPHADITSQRPPTPLDHGAETPLYLQLRFKTVASVIIPGFIGQKLRLIDKH